MTELFVRPRHITNFNPEQLFNDSSSEIDYGVLSLYNADTKYLRRRPFWGVYAYFEESSYKHR